MSPNPEVVEKWEAELSAAIEAEYRRQRADLLGVVECWLRDVWVLTLEDTAGKSDRCAASPVRSRETLAAEIADSKRELLYFPEIGGTRRIGGRISTADATANLQVLEQLQRWLSTNVQEALALEVGLLKLRL